MSDNMIPATPRPSDQPHQFHACENNCRSKLNDYCDVHNITGHAKLIIVGTLSTFTTDHEREAYTNNVIDCEPPTNDTISDNDNYSMNSFDTLTPTPSLVTGAIKVGSVAMFVGGSKSYKTWHLARLGLCISQGIPWFGFTTRKSKVLMVNPELIANEFQIRIGKLADTISISKDKIDGNFCSWSLRRKKFDPDNLVELIKKKIVAEKIEVVLLDSLYRLYGERTDENSNSDMMKLMLKLEDLCCLDGVSVIFSHHTPKGSQDGKRVIDVAAGAGALGRFVDTAIVTTAIDEEPVDGFQRFGLRIVYRYDSAPKPMGLIMNGPRADIDYDFNKAELQPNNKFNNSTILNVLKEAPATYGELLAKVKTLTGMSDASFKRYWKAVKEIPGVTEFEGKWRYQSPGMDAPIPTIKK
jgi:hypothetical protein